MLITFCLSSGDVYLSLGISLSFSFVIVCNFKKQIRGFCSEETLNGKLHFLCSHIHAVLYFNLFPLKKILQQRLSGTKYSRMNQEKNSNASLQQILRGLFFNTLSHLIDVTSLSQVQRREIYSIQKPCRNIIFQIETNIAFDMLFKTWRNNTVKNRLMETQPKLNQAAQSYCNRRIFCLFNFISQGFCQVVSQSSSGIPNRK